MLWLLIGDKPRTVSPTYLDDRRICITGWYILKQHQILSITCSVVLELIKYLWYCATDKFCALVARDGASIMLLPQYFNFSLS